MIKYITYDEFNFRKSEALTYRTRTYADNITILIRFPEKVSTTAILLIFHSCRHSAYDWFHTAERQRIIGSAIKLGYACLAFQSSDKLSQCWSNNPDIYDNKDVQMVFKGLEGFYKEYPQLGRIPNLLFLFNNFFFSFFKVSLPRFTFGSSSGGIFSSIFAINQLYELQGQILFTSIILPEILYTYVKGRNYPTTVFYTCKYKIRQTFEFF